jgi:hypothetical protein
MEAERGQECGGADEKRSMHEHLYHERNSGVNADATTWSLKIVVAAMVIHAFIFLFSKHVWIHRLVSGTRAT